MMIYLIRNLLIWTIYCQQLDNLDDTKNCWCGSYVCRHAFHAVLVRSINFSWPIHRTIIGVQWSHYKICHRINVDSWQYPSIVRYINKLRLCCADQAIFEFILFPILDRSIQSMQTIRCWLELSVKWNRRRYRFVATERIVANWTLPTRMGI